MWGRYERGVAQPGAEILSAMAEGGMDLAYILTAQPEALRQALSDIKTATDSAARAGVSREDAIVHQTAEFERLQAIRRHEAELLKDYRQCEVADQTALRQMASRLAATTIAKGKTPRRKP